MGVSNGAESCKAGLPGIFTRVSHYSDWISLAQDTARRVSDVDQVRPWDWHQDRDRHHHARPHRYHQNHHQNYHRNHRLGGFKKSPYTVNKQHFSNFENAFFPTKSKFRPRPSFGQFYHSQYFY